MTRGCGACEHDGGELVPVSSGVARTLMVDGGGICAVARLSSGDVARVLAAGVGETDTPVQKQHPRGSYVDGRRWCDIRRLWFGQQSQNTWLVAVWHE